jgi:hypothetical protein
LDAPGDNRRIGLRINDPNGAERFGASYMEDGRVVLGLDAPPGTGDDRNRERINLVADEKGALTSVSSTAVRTWCRGCISTSRTWPG